LIVYFAVFAPSFSMQWGKRAGEIGEHRHYSNGFLGLPPAMTLFVPMKIYGNDDDR
jgi:hypothetical protein